jgi:Ser/Thr protein kinase RdoA (MazF antagonist)
VPSPAQFVEASEDKCLYIGGKLGRSGALLALKDDAENGSLYRYDADDGERLFLKIVPASRLKSLKAGEDVARWLSTRGIQAVAAHEGCPISLEEGTWLFSYPFMDGEMISSSITDLEQLGRDVANLHLALGNHPDIDAWGAATKGRLEGLLDVREALAKGELSAGPDPDRLAAMARHPDCDFTPGDRSATPLHGDLNLGNLLKRPDGTILFLDFEDTAHSVLPPEFELGLIVERFVLINEPDDKKAQPCVRKLFGGYISAGGVLGDDAIRAMPQTLRSLAFRNMCGLAWGERMGLERDQQEWQKFFKLFDLSKARRAVFEELV